MADEEVVEQENEGTETETTETETTETETEGGAGNNTPEAVTTETPIAVVPDRPTPYTSLYTSRYEVPGSRQLRINATGITGSYTIRGFLYKWAAENNIPIENGEDIDFYGPGGICPIIGTPWDNAYPCCRLQDIELKECENGLGEATLNYTSDGYTANMKTSIDFASQTHKVCGNVKWAVNTPGTSTEVANPYVDSIDFTDAYINYKVSYTYIFDLDAYYQAHNKYPDIETYIAFAAEASGAYNSINSCQYHGFRAQSMLCTSLDLQPTYDIQGILLSIEINAGFKIFRDSHSHNYMWKEPVPLPDSQGNDIIWHNIPNQPYPYNQFYTTDTYRVGTKVYTDDITIATDSSGLIYITPVVPTPQHGGWYAPYMEYYNATIRYQGDWVGYHQMYLYDQVNFERLLHIPRLPSDPDPDDPHAN